MFEFIVSGMTCGGCVNSVTRALKGLDSNASVEVSLDSQTIRIKSDKDQKDISEAIEEAGFSVQSGRKLND